MACHDHNHARPCHPIIRLQLREQAKVRTDGTVDITRPLPVEMEEVMADNKTKVAQDRRRIDMHQDYGLDYWSHKFGVSKDELKAAVEGSEACPTTWRGGLENNTGMGGLSDPLARRHHQ